GEPCRSDTFRAFGANIGNVVFLAGPENFTFNDVPGFRLELDGLFIAYDMIGSEDDAVTDAHACAVTAFGHNLDDWRWSRGCVNGTARKSHDGEKQESRRDVEPRRDRAHVERLS